MWVDSILGYYYCKFYNVEWLKNCMIDKLFIKFSDLTLFFYQSFMCFGLNCRTSPLSMSAFNTIVQQSDAISIGPYIDLIQQQKIPHTYRTYVYKQLKEQKL